MSHPGSYSCYQSGCRESACRLAHKIRMSRYRAEREQRGGRITERGIEGGRLGVPIEEVLGQVADLRKTMTRREIARRAGISEKTIYDLSISRKRRYVFPRTAEAIRNLWEDYCAPVEQELPRRWPAEPIRAAVVARFGSLKASPWRRDVARLLAKRSISTWTADRWAARLERMPHELWPDWYVADLEEAC